MDKRYCSPFRRSYHEEGGFEEDKKPEEMSWVSRTASSHSVQLAATAVVSGAVVAGAILGFQRMRRKLKIENLKSSIPDVGEDHQAGKVPCVMHTRTQRATTDYCTIEALRIRHSSIHHPTKQRG